MKDRIKGIAFSQLRNEGYFNFHSEFATLVNECELSEDFIALREIYNECYDELDDALEEIRKSVFTKQLLAADRQRVYTYRRLRAAVRGFLRNVDQVKQLAAERVIIVIRHYGNLLKTSRDERTGTLTHLLDDLRREGTADLLALGLTTWVSELDTNNLSYKKLKDSRIDERKQRRPAKDVDEARVVVDAAYRGLIYYLESYGMTKSGDANYENLVASLNLLLDGYARLLAQRQGVSAARREKEVLASSSSSSSSVG